MGGWAKAAVVRNASIDSPFVPVQDGDAAAPVGGTLVAPRDDPGEAQAENLGHCVVLRSMRAGKPANQDQDTLFSSSVE